MKIRTKNGEEIDLSEYRRSLEAVRDTNIGSVAFNHRLAILDAFESAISVPVKHEPPYPGVEDAINEVVDIYGDSEDIGDACYFVGRESMRQSVRQSAGVIDGD